MKKIVTSILLFQILVLLTAVNMKSEAKSKDNAKKITVELKPVENTDAYIKESAKAYAYSTKEVRNLIRYSKKYKYNGKKLVFLTFDDGVNNVVSPQILDTLKKNEVHATFFVVGYTVIDKTKNVLKREYEEGHSIAIHSYNHVYKDLYPRRTGNPEAIKNQAIKTENAIKKYLGKDYKATVWRYPGGRMSWKNMDASDRELEKLGIQWMDWNAAVGDAVIGKNKPSTEEQMVNYFLNTLKSASSNNCVVVLMHDAAGKKLTAKSLDRIIKILKDKGYSFGILV